MAKTTLPPVPRDVPKSLAMFLTSMRETVQVQSGMGRGNALDKAVTFRDLKAGAGINDLRQLGRAVKASEGGGEAFDDPTPPRPTGFEAYGMFTTVGLNWDRPSGDWYLSTQVFRVDTTNADDKSPTFSESQFVGSSTSGFYSDSVNPSSTYVYWIRHLNRDSVAGSINSPDGLEATTQEDPEKVLEDFSEQVANGKNFEWLRSDLAGIDALNRSLQGNGFGDSALTRLLGESSSVSDLLAEQALSDSIYKYTQNESIQRQFSKNYARLSGGIHAAVNADEAYVLRIQELEAHWENDLGNIIDSKITSFETVLAGEQGAIAETLKEHKVNFNGESVSLQQLASAAASTESGYQAQWGVKTNVAGLKGGVGFLNDGEKTSFVVDAQTFAVTGGEDEVFPFIIKDGKTVIDQAIIKDASIYNLISANITAENIKAGISITSPHINGGVLEGGSLDISGRFSVDTRGIMRAKDAFFEGDIKAKAGTLDNVTINESCSIEGTLSAKNIDGDIVDRTVIVVEEDTEVTTGQVFTIISGTITPDVIGRESDRYLVVSGISIDHQNGGGSHSHVDINLYFDGELVQTFYSKNVGEEGSVTVQLGCIVPKGGANHSFKVTANPHVSDTFLVQQSAIVADVFKTGSTLTNVRGLYF